MSEHNLLKTLETMLSEQRNPNTLHIDALSSLEVVTLLNHEDKQVAFAVEKNLPRIAQAVEHIVAAFQSGGRLVPAPAAALAYSMRPNVRQRLACHQTWS